MINTLEKDEDQYFVYTPVNREFSEQERSSMPLIIRNGQIVLCVRKKVLRK
tara:strand:+ start:605 stop:757 length:153 start_codon:yes stop_codon:yes gene_type:complete